MTNWKYLKFSSAPLYSTMPHHNKIWRPKIGDKYVIMETAEISKIRIVLWLEECVMTCLDVLVRNVLMIQPVMYHVPVKGNITTEMTSAGGCAMSTSQPPPRRHRRTRETLLSPLLCTNTVMPGLQGRVNEGFTSCTWIVLLEASQAHKQTLKIE